MATGIRAALPVSADDPAAPLVLNLPEVDWSPGLRRELARRTRVLRLARGQAAFEQGAPTQALYGVLSGEMALRFGASDGSVSVVEHAPPGRLFGLASFASGRRATYEAVATRASRLLVIGPQAYVWLMDEVPGFGRALMREFARRHDGALRMLEASRLRPASERLALALAQLQRDGRTRAGRGEAVFVQTTQAELAALAGVSRQTANEWLAAQAAAGRLRTGYGGVWLPPTGRRR
jgi:CRP-like cAMP-binding protein